MPKRISISLHPIFIVLTIMYFLIFFTYGIVSLKELLLKGYQQNAMIGIVVSVIAILLSMYLCLVRYRVVKIYNNRYVLESLIGTRTIYFTEIKSIKKVPLNLFNYSLGSLGVMGIISLNSKGGDTYNVSDLKNTIRISLTNNEILHISCDNPEELVLK
jgi:hypothetical protein